MPALINLVGKTFNSLTVVRRAPNKFCDPKARWECRCVCGNIKITKGINLIRGDTKSCGCRKKLDAPRGKNNKRFIGYEDISGTYWAALKTGAKTRQFCFSLKIEQGWELFIKQNKKCALSGIPLVFAVSMK